MKDISDIFYREYDCFPKKLDHYYPVEGVYFLIFKNEIAYIGKSKHIQKRIGQHIQAGLIQFDDVFYEKFCRFEWNTLDDMEEHWIKRYNPKYNVKKKQRRQPFTNLMSNFYFLVYSKNPNFYEKVKIKTIYEDIVKKTKMIEYVVFKNGKFSSLNQVNYYEIGIGKSKKDAIDNYGKW